MLIEVPSYVTVVWVNLKWMTGRYCEWFFMLTSIQSQGDRMVLQTFQERGINRG